MLGNYRRLNLRWNDHSNVIINDLAKKYERQECVDVTIACQGQFIKAHRIVLAACSPFFNDIFAAHEGVAHPIIILKGYNFDHIQSLVDYMYKGHMIVNPVDMQQLVETAKELQVKGFQNSGMFPDANAFIEFSKKMGNHLGNKMGTGKDGGGRSSQGSSNKGGIIDKVISEALNGKWNKKAGNVSGEIIKPGSSKQMDKKEGGGATTLKRIPRPPNAYMIFANEWRCQLLDNFPNESNNDISVKLGEMWKNMKDDVKTAYYSAARIANDEHKQKYPGYHYNPKESRVTKKRKLQEKKGKPNPNAAENPELQATTSDSQAVQNKSKNGV